MRASALGGVGLLLLLAVVPGLSELQVTVSPERVAPVTLGDARVWNAYVTVTVARDGRPWEGASVELRGPSGAIASGNADASGRVLLPVLAREPLSIEVWVDGTPSGKRVEAAAGGTASTGASAAASGAAAPGPSGTGGWLLGGAAVGIGVLFSVFIAKKRFKRRN